MQNLFVMFVTAICFLFLLNLKWPNDKTLYELENLSLINDNLNYSSDRALIAAKHGREMRQRCRATIYRLNLSLIIVT